MVDRLLKYLIYSMDLSLVYYGNGNGLDAFSDANLADCKGSVTTCGYLIRLYEDVVIWKTRKQNEVALSTCEAVYLAMSEVCKELFALSLTMKEFVSSNLYPMKVYCDNNAAIASTKIEGGNALRHVIEIKAHYIKKCVDKGLVQVALSFQLYENLANRIMSKD